MNQPSSSSSWTKERSRNEETRTPSASRPRRGLAIRFQLGGRLKVLYGIDPAPMPDAIGDLLLRLEGGLQKGKCPGSTR